MNVQALLWTAEGARQVRVEPSPLANENGVAIPAAALRCRFVRYVIAEEENQLAPDILDNADRLDLPPQWVMLSLLVLGPGTISVSLVPGFGEARPALRWSVAVLLNWLCVVVAFFVWALAAVAWIARGV